jgi:hypothetical protein
MLLSKKRSKKAQYAFMAQLIIAILAFVLIAMTISKFMVGKDTKEAEILCQQSIAIRAATTLQIGDDAEFTALPMLCKTLDKKVETGKREEVKKEIADMMARCWWMFNEGRYDDAMDTAQLGNMLGFDSDSNKCFICYSALVEGNKKDIIEGGDITKGEMYKYLSETQYPKMKNTTYSQYIEYKGGGPGATYILSDIEPDTGYAITFLSKSDDDSRLTWADAVGGAIVTVAAVGIAACVFITPCNVGLAVSAATSSATAAAATTAVTLTTVAATTYEVKHAINLAKAKFYTEQRDVSMVFFDTLSSAQSNECVIADVAGR